jgi:hypothetical protein
MHGCRALTKALGAALLVLAACPDTTSKFGGSSAGDDEVGETPVEGDVVEDHRTYFIGESTKFDGGGECDNATLNMVTNTLHNRLQDAGWSGLRYVDEDTWPEDFRDSTISAFALDDVHADAARLAVYAGHGGIGRLQWGHPSPEGECLTHFDDEMRLGRLEGDKAAATMLMTSCVLRVDQAWAALRDNACRQFFGYHDSPHIGYDEARKVFKRSQDGQPTAEAWLEEMVHNALGSNSPVVFTMGVDAADAIGIHAMTNLATGAGFMQNVGEPIDGHFYEWFDNGCSSACGNCGESNAPPPDLAIGTIAPRLKATRPSRSRDELLDLAVELLARFGIQAANPRLEAWASEVIASRDVTWARILDEPRIDITYDPTSDQLRITDRSALERARPRPGELLDDDANLESALRSEAERIREQLPTAMLVRLAGEFEVSTREVGFGDGAALSPSIAYEWLFTSTGRIDDLALEGHGLTIGMTRLGELATLLVSSVDVEIAGDARIVQTPAQALGRLWAAIHAEYPDAVEIEFVEPEVGYALAEAELAAEVVPSLLVSHVVTFGAGESRVVSRRFPVRISLTATEAPIESLLAPDPTPQSNDIRDAH